MAMSYSLRLCNGYRVEWEAHGPVSSALLREIARIAGWKRETAGIAIVASVCDGAPPPGTDCFSIWPQGFEGKFLLCRPNDREFRFYLDLPDLSPRQLLFFSRAVTLLPLIPMLVPGDAVLCHGALATFGGRGFLLCGQSGIGKSTAIGGLPESWRGHCDDSLLLFRRADGYFAQPLPTWTRRYCRLPEALYQSCDVIRVDRLYLLGQSEEDRIEDLVPLQQKLGVAESLSALYYVFRQGAKEAERNTLMLHTLDFSRNLVRELPVRRLNARLHGEFWKLLENEPHAE